MSFNTLMTVDQLRQQLGSATLVVFDCRHDLMNPAAGAEAYARGHVPGARFARSDEDLAGPKTGRNGRHPLPAPDTFMQWLGSQGVGHDTQVVAYDSFAGAGAARLWWLLRWVGHTAVAVLDGGWEAWTAAGAPVSTEVPRPVPVHFSGSVRDSGVDAAFVQAHIGQPGVLVVDARSPERYRGESEPIDPVAGHIPGARNRFYRDNLDAAGRFKAPAALRAELEAFLAGTAPAAVVHQCGSGVTACHNLLAMEVAGLTGSRLYPGSWSEWVADPARPVARGA